MFTKEICKSPGVPRLVAPSVVTTLLLLSSIAWAVNPPSLRSPEDKAPVVRVAAGAGLVNGTLELVINGTDKELEDDKFIASPREAVDKKPAPLVEYSTLLPLQLDAAGRRWVLPLSVKDMPAGIDQTRYVAVRVGGKDTTLSYRLTNPVAESAWKIFPSVAGTRVANPPVFVAFHVTVDGSAPVRGLRLAPSEFVDKSTGWTLAGGQLAVCDKPAPCEGEGIEVPPKGKQVWIAARQGSAQGSETPTIWPGQYEGVFALSSEGKAAVETSNITIYVSTWYWKLLGVATILIGVVLALYFSTFVRSRATRWKMLQAPVVLREKIDHLLELLGVVPVTDMPILHARMKQIDDDLTDASLEAHGLSGAIPSPWKDVVADVQAFQAWVQGQSTALAALAVIVEQGVVEVDRIIKANTAGGQVLTQQENATRAAALASLDDLAQFTAAPPAADLAVKVAAIVSTLNSAPAQERDILYKLGVNSMTDGALAPIRTVKTLQIQIERDNVQAWYFIAGATTVVGAFILILSNHGFGTPQDLLGCLLWGVGLPAGAALATSTTGAVATTLNVSH